MNKVILTICFIFIGVLSSFSETSEKSKNEFGIELSQITYKEPGLMEESGNMFGLSFSSASYDSFMFKGEGRYSSGTVDYTGAYSDGTPLSIDNIKDYGWESRILVGGRASDSERTYIYTGLGYRYLNDAPPVSQGGYERESNYYYIPIGIEFIPAVKNDWSVGATIEYDIFLQGKQISHLSDFDPGLPDVTNAQKNGYGYRVSIKFQSPDQKTVIAPFIRYWNIEKSEDEYIYYGGDTYVCSEPKNNSNEIGIKFGWKF